MKTLVTGIALSCAMALPLSAATTINPVNRFAYGANIGWQDWRGDVANGAVIGQFTCSGYIYAANTAWIHLGDGTPVNNLHYQNNAANDYGVNHDGAGNLRGYAYGANIGWVTFTNRDANGVVFDGPKVDLLTGKMSGYVWSANCGWISLSNSQAYVQTDSISKGKDSDGDGLPDDWEISHAGNTSTLEGTGDADHDGQSDLAEYLADTDPLDPSSVLRITLFQASASGTSDLITWNSQPSRQYRILKRTALTGAFPWSDVGVGLINPDPGSSTTRLLSDSPSVHRFFQIEAIDPLP